MELELTKYGVKMAIPDNLVIRKNDIEIQGDTQEALVTALNDFQLVSMVLQTADGTVTITPTSAPKMDNEKIGSDHKNIKTRERQFIQQYLVQQFPTQQLPTLQCQCPCVK